MAPGGIAEMCLAGMSMGADVSVIVTYQIVRVLLMNLTMPFCSNGISTKITKDERLTSPDHIDRIDEYSFIGNGEERKE